MRSLVPRLSQEGVELLWRWPDARQGWWYRYLRFLMDLGSNHCSGDARMWEVTAGGVLGVMRLWPPLSVLTMVGKGSCSVTDKSKHFSVCLCSSC